MVNRRLEVPYRGQQGVNFCGPACAQMVIEAVGRKSESQQALFDLIAASWVLDRESPWGSSPDGLQTSLNHVAGLPPGAFDVVSFDTEPTLTRWLLWSVAQGVPAIALCEGWAHWVVVAGYETSRHPLEAGDTGYDIASLYVHDPWSDQSGLTVSFADWQLHYLWKVPSGHWQGRLVGVGVFGPSGAVSRPPVAPASAKQ
jgi:hypothetical protein